MRMKKIEGKYVAINDYLDISEACEYLGVSRQAVYIAAKHNRIECMQFKNHRWFSKKSLDDYLENRYSRKFSMRGDKPLFDKNEYSVQQAADKLDKSSNHVYYILRKGLLTHSRKGYAYIISQKDIDKYLSKKNPPE